MNIKSGYVGKECQYEFRENENIKFIYGNPVYADLNKALHTTIIAKSGAGKSYTMRVLIEEEMLNGVFAFIGFDPIGLLHTLIKENKLEDMGREFGIFPRSFDNIQIFSPGGVVAGTIPFHLSPKEATPDTFAYVFELGGTKPQVGLYRKAYIFCEERNRFDLNFMRNTIVDQSDSWGYAANTREAVLSKLDILVQMGILGSDGFNVVDIIKPNARIVFDFSRSGDLTARLFVSFLARSILAERQRRSAEVKQTVDDEVEKYIEGYIPPVAIYIDEAHLYMPNNYDLIKICRIGRNFGIKLTAISQKVNLPEDLYENSAYFYLGKLQSSSQIAKISDQVPLKITPGAMEKDLKIMPVGCYMFFDATKEPPIKKQIRIRPSYTRHLSATDIGGEKKYILNYRQQRPKIIEKILCDEEEDGEMESNDCDEGELEEVKDIDRNFGNVVIEYSSDKNYYSGEIVLNYDHPDLESEFFTIVSNKGYPLNEKYDIIFNQKKKRAVVKVSQKSSLGDVNELFLMRITKMDNKKDAIATLINIGVIGADASEIYLTRFKTIA